MKTIQTYSIKIESSKFTYGRCFLVAANSMQEAIEKVSALFKDDEKFKVKEVSESLELLHT